MSKKETHTDKPHPLLVYYHRGKVTPLRTLLQWWVKTPTTLDLLIRTDEDDPTLPEVEAIADEFKEHAWSWMIGPRVNSTSDVVLEVWGEMPERDPDLVYATNKASDIAMFMLSYGHEYTE